LNYYNFFDFWINYINYQENLETIKSMGHSLSWIMRNILEVK